MYKPIVAILVTAEKATELPRLGSARMKLSVQASHTVRTIRRAQVHGRRGYWPVRIGDFVPRDTLWKNLCPGMPPSRAKAYIIRLFDVIEHVPHMNIAPMTMTCCADEDTFKLLTLGIGTSIRTYHEDYRSLFPNSVQENLSDGFPSWRVHSACQVLYWEEKAQNKEPAKNSRDSDSNHNPRRPCYRRVVCFFRHLSSFLFFNMF